MAPAGQVLPSSERSVLCRPGAVASEGAPALTVLGAACPECEMRGWPTWTAYLGTPLLEVWRKPAAGEQTRMGRERGDRSKGEGKRRPRRLHTNRRLGTASVDEARLENVSGYKLDGAQRPPVEVEFGSVCEVEPLQRERDFAGPVRYPPWLGITRCLTTASGVPDRRAHQGADHKARAAKGSDAVVSVPTAPEGSPSQTLSRPNSKCTISVLQSCGRGHNWSAGHLPFENIGEDVA